METETEIRVSENIGCVCGGEIVCQQLCSKRYICLNGIAAAYTKVNNVIIIIIIIKHEKLIKKNMMKIKIK